MRSVCRDQVGLRPVAEYDRCVPSTGRPVSLHHGRTPLRDLGPSAGSFSHAGFHWLRKPGKNAARTRIKKRGKKKYRGEPPERVAF